MIRRPPRSTPLYSSAASDVYKRQLPILGTPPAAIDAAEDRGAFGRVLGAAGLPAPAFGTATTLAEAQRVADGIGYPLRLRPSYVLGGRGMEIVYNRTQLSEYVSRALLGSNETAAALSN